MDQTVPVPAQVTGRYLHYLPVGLFGSVMGTTGLSIAWQLAASRYGAPLWISQSIAGVAALGFVTLLISYGIKLLTATDAVRAEFLHPIAGSLFGTIFISLLLLPIVIAPVNLPLARGVWVVGAIAMLWFAWRSVSWWMSNRQHPTHATPTWIVPVVGMLDVPLALPHLNFPPWTHDLMVFSVAVGLFFAIPIFTLILSRLMFEAPMPDALQPTLLILIAPFSIGFVAYVMTAGQIDAFAQSLYYLMLFLLAILLGRLRKLPYCCPFRLSWWAVSFPLAASAGAALRFAQGTPGLIYLLVAWALLALATLVILGLLVRTLVGVARGELKNLTV